MKHGLFAFTSQTHLCIFKDCVPYHFEGKLSVNNNGFGVCGTLPLPLPPIKLGFGYDAKAKALEFTGCDLDKYETTDGSQAKAAQAGGFARR